MTLGSGIVTVRIWCNDFHLHMETFQNLPSFIICNCKEVDYLTFIVMMQLQLTQMQLLLIA